MRLIAALLSAALAAGCSGVRWEAPVNPRTSAEVRTWPGLLNASPGLQGLADGIRCDCHPDWSVWICHSLGARDAAEVLNAGASCDLLVLLDPFPYGLQLRRGVRRVLVITGRAAEVLAPPGVPVDVLRLPSAPLFNETLGHVLLPLDPAVRSAVLAVLPLRPRAAPPVR